MLKRRARERLEFFVCGSLRGPMADDPALARGDRVLDPSWPHEEVAALCGTGVARQGIDPEAAVRRVLAGVLLGIVHDRRPTREAQANPAIGGAPATACTSACPATPRSRASGKDGALSGSGPCSSGR